VIRVCCISFNVVSKKIAYVSWPACLLKRRCITLCFIGRLLYMKVTAHREVDSFRLQEAFIQCVNMTTCVFPSVKSKGNKKGSTASWHPLMESVQDIKCIYCLQTVSWQVSILGCGYNALMCRWSPRHLCQRSCRTVTAQWQMLRGSHSDTETSSNGTHVWSLMNKGSQ